MVAMTGTATAADARPKRGNGAARGLPAGGGPNAPVLVSGSRLAVHFGCIRQHVEQLAVQGVIERRADGKFDQDQSRLKYLAHLRRENRRSPRTEADAEHAAAKAELLRLRIAERKHELMPVSEHEAFVDEMAGLLLSRLSGAIRTFAGVDRSAIARSRRRMQPMPRA
jgi:hypothetical protein